MKIYRQIFPMMGVSRILAAVIGASAFSAFAGAQTFGTASTFNLYAAGNLTSQFSDTEGRVGAGGNISLEGYDVALKSPGGDVLIAGGNVSFKNGTNRGNIRYGGTVTTQNLGFTNGGAAIAGNPFDFAAATTFLRTNSTYWGGLSTTGTVTRPFSTILLHGSNPVQNVFTFNASLFSGSSDINIVVPSGSTVLVNILGTSVTLPGFGYNLNGSQDNNAFRKVLWNLPQATTVNLGSIRGSVLAPYAAVSGTFGAVEGQLFTGSFNGPTQVNLYDFNGSLAPVPEPASLAALGLGVAALARRRRAKKA